MFSSLYVRAYAERMHMFTSTRHVKEEIYGDEEILSTLDTSNEIYETLDLVAVIMK